MGNGISVTHGGLGTVGATTYQFGGSDLTVHGNTPINQVPQVSRFRPKEPTILEHRQKIVKLYDCGRLFQELQDVYDNVTETEERRASLDAQFSAAKSNVDDMDDMCMVDGKNAEERRANKVRALRTDNAYLAAVRSRDALAEQLKQCDVDLGTTSRHAKLLEYRIKYNMSVLRLFGGDE